MDSGESGEVDPMRILYVSQYYPPEMGAPAARVSELAREWQKRGHEVTVLTAFPHHPHGKKRPEDVGVMSRREQDGDVKVVRTYVFAGAIPVFFSGLSVICHLCFPRCLLDTGASGVPTS